MSYNLLLLTRNNMLYRELLEKASLPELTILDDNPEQLANADILLAEPAFAAPLLTRMPKLKWLQSSFAGVDALVDAFAQIDFEVTNIKGVFGPAMSEYVFGYLLTHYRDAALYQQQQNQRYWLPNPSTSVANKRMLILGTGSIGQHLATTAKHFSMEVWGLNRTGNMVEPFDQIITEERLESVLTDFDVVVNVLPSTLLTRGTLCSTRLRLLNDNALFFNIGRGDILDINELTAELQRRPSLTAVLDVFAEEPLVPKHPIWGFHNAIITPHISAQTLPHQVVSIFEENYNRFFEQKPLLNKVDLERGY